MRNQLELLYQLQTIDMNIMNSEKQQSRYNKKLADLDEKMTQDEENFKQEQGQLEIIEKEHREIERLLQTMDDQKKKIEDKLLAIKTNREYQASLAEIEKVNQSIKTKEDDAIAHLDDIDSAKQQVEQLRKEFQKTKTIYEEQKKQIEQDFKNHLKDIEQQKQEGAVLAKDIEPEVFATYEKIKKVRHGYAVAIAADEQCMGCSMKIPPQTYNEAVCSKKIMTCPHCNRILYVETEKENLGD